MSREQEMDALYARVGSRAFAVLVGMDAMQACIGGKTTTFLVPEIISWLHIMEDNDAGRTDNGQSETFKVRSEGAASRPDGLL